jgi:hypothetical protein
MLRVMELNEQCEALMRFFSYDHLPERLQPLSQPFCELAHQLDELVLCSPQKVVMLQRLLESKDAAVRTAL